MIVVMENDNLRGEKGSIDSSLSIRGRGHGVYNSIIPMSPINAVRSSIYINRVSSFLEAQVYGCM
jgi:hypothetical protein